MKPKMQPEGRPEETLMTTVDGQDRATGTPTNEVADLKLEAVCHPRG